MLMRVFTLFLCLFYQGIFLSSVANADIAIIANKTFPLNSIDRQQAKKLWLGEIRKLPNTGKVKVLDQSKDSSIKEKFYAELTNKTLSQLKVHWAKIIFTGKAVPPKNLSSDKKVIDYVIKKDNFLGYINSQSVTDDIKVLLTINDMEKVK